MNKGKQRISLSAAAALLAISMGACSFLPDRSTAPSPLAAAPPLASQTRPNYLDCAIISTATPRTFACPDGRTYTSFQLAGLRPLAK